MSDRSYRYLLRSAGFTDAEVTRMAATKQCEFPRCRVMAESRALHSDHAHACAEVHTSRICPECYRGEVCWGHNTLLGSLDRHPEWAGSEELAYMMSRPLSRKNILLFPRDRTAFDSRIQELKAFIAESPEIIRLYSSHVRKIRVHSFLPKAERETLKRAERNRTRDWRLTGLIC
jgi:hypothetical protein